MTGTGVPVLGIVFTIIIVIVIVYNNKLPSFSSFSSSFLSSDHVIWHFVLVG